MRPIVKNLCQVRRWRQFHPERQAAQAAASRQSQQHKLSLGPAVGSKRSAEAMLASLRVAVERELSEFAPRVAWPSGAHPRKRRRWPYRVVVCRRRGWRSCCRKRDFKLYQARVIGVSAGVAVTKAAIGQDMAPPLRVFPLASFGGHGWSELRLCSFLEQNTWGVGTCLMQRSRWLLTKHVSAASARAGGTGFRRIQNSVPPESSFHGKHVLQHNLVFRRSTWRRRHSRRNAQAFEESRLACEEAHHMHRTQSESTAFANGCSSQIGACLRDRGSLERTVSTFPERSQRQESLLGECQASCQRLLTTF